jgi:transposase
MKTKPPHRGVELSPGTRREIIGLHDGGMIYEDIEKKMLVKSNTAGKVYRRRNNGHKSNSAPRSGRPTKLNENDCQQLHNYVLQDRNTRRQPLTDISQNLNLNVCPNTLHYELQQMGLGHQIARKRPWLSDRQKEARLQFAQEHIHWTKEDWHHVEFSDEMGMQTGANDNRVYVWRYPEEEYTEDCCSATHKSGFKKIKVWGSMRYGSLSNLVILLEKKGDGKFNSQEYVKEIMDRELFECWSRGMEELGDIIIMEDGAGYHCGAATARRKQYQEDGWQGWGPKVWPASSPDLNPIENLWHLLDTNIKK